MRILHSGTLDANAGGPAMSTYLALHGLRQLGEDARIVMPPLSAGGKLRGEDVPIHWAPAPWHFPPKIAYSPRLKRVLRQVGAVDVYHAQGIWLYHTYALASVARQAGAPYLISPRGMLYPQDIAKSNAGFKRLSLRLRLLADLNGAACVHATCREEADHCRRLGVKSPICIVPNPVEVRSHYPAPRREGGFRIGYLGRVSRRKNIDGLIRAYQALGTEADGTELVVIGDGDEAYKQELHQLATRVEHGRVRFLGFLNGAEKDAALAQLSLMVMPSEFENLGNVILEGLVRRIPCIATQGAPWEELRTHRCGWWIDYYDPQALPNALREALHTPEDELRAMGERGHSLMQERYSVEAVAQQLRDVYRWVCRLGQRPACVQTNSTINLGGAKDPL